MKRDFMTSDLVAHEISRQQLSDQSGAGVIKEWVKSFSPAYTVSAECTCSRTNCYKVASDIYHGMNYMHYFRF